MTSFLFIEVFGKLKLGREGPIIDGCKVRKEILAHHGISLLVLVRAGHWLAGNVSGVSMFVIQGPIVVFMAVTEYQQQQHKGVRMSIVCHDREGIIPKMAHSWAARVYKWLSVKEAEI